MALLASDDLAERYTRMKYQATRLKSRCSVANTLLAAGDTAASYILELYTFLGTAEGVLDAVALLSGIGDHAKTVEDDPAYDVVTELGVVSSACASSRTWIEANIPDSNGWLLVSQFAGGEVVPREFTSVQTAGLRTALQAIIDAIST